MRAILVGSVKTPYRELSSLQLRSNDLLIGIDGGLRTWAKWGVRPHFAIGDWDSLKKKSLLSKVPHVTLSLEKNRSDLFYSAVAAIEAGASELLCLGVTGGRMDHHLAALYDLVEFSKGQFGKLTSVEAKGPEADYYFLSEKIPFWRKTLPHGSLVSLFGMNQGAKGVTLSGFQYKLKDGDLRPSSHGLSNRALGKSSSVRLKKGQLLIIIPREGVNDYGT